MIHIVLGSLFGDEGKGQAVHSLSQETTLVVRFSGGHQVGHTVCTNGKEHVFSQFGSGTFKQAGTYISHYCTIYPKGIKWEYDILQPKCTHNILDAYWIDPLAMVTTPYDIGYNKVIEGINKHGSVGVGFGATIGRNEEHMTLYASDLLVDSIYQNKMWNIGRYYDTVLSNLPLQVKIDYEAYVVEEFDKWCDSIEWFRKNIKVSTPEHYPNTVFEGSQGILLDKNLGIFPHVTRSNTTALNACEILGSLPRLSLSINDTPMVNYVVRAYMTRHGNGPFKEGDVNLHPGVDAIMNNPESNWQGKFRIAPMDFNLLAHSIRMNNSIVSRYFKNFYTKLIVTCCDQVESVDTEKFKDMPVDVVNYKQGREWI